MYEFMSLFPINLNFASATAFKDYCIKRGTADDPVIVEAD